MKHIIDTDELLKIASSATSSYSDYLEVKKQINALISNSPQADDVRKDAERWQYLKDKYAMVNFDIYDAESKDERVTGIIFEMPNGIRYSADINATIDQAIDKARE